MNISEEKLREIVARVMRQLEAESASRQVQEKRRLYLMCLGGWDERYADFLRTAGEDEKAGQYEICALIPPEWRKNNCEALLKSNGFCLTQTYEEAERLTPKEGEITVYPVVPNYLLAKAAFCMDDAFEAGWLISCFEQGSRAVFLRSGLRRFTGREPGAYQERILSYLRAVLQYGVEITARDELELAPGCSETISLQKGKNPRILNKEENSRQKDNFQIKRTQRKAVPERPSEHRIITSGDVEKFKEQGVITLYPGDQITDVAKDRAKYLKISVKRADTP